jgi:signal transduction histidine kinase
MLFVPFTRSTDPGGGSGLGLATADAAVRALGGRIGYRDRPGGGAWFWFRLPTPSAA